MRPSPVETALVLYTCGIFSIFFFLLCGNKKTRMERDTRQVYRTTAVSTGDGRNGHSRTTDGMIDVDLATPKEQGGPGGATNPEQLFAAGYAGCFHSSLKVAARGEGITLTGSEVTVTVDCSKRTAPFRLGGRPSPPTCPAFSREQGEQLLQQAHQRCPYSKATRGNIDVQLTQAPSGTRLANPHLLHRNMCHDHGVVFRIAIPPDACGRHEGGCVHQFPSFLNGKWMRGGAVHHTIAAHPFLGRYTPPRNTGSSPSATGSPHRGWSTRRRCPSPASSTTSR